MDTPGTLALPIRCSCCDASFRARMATNPRAAWRQLSISREDGATVTGYLCDLCSEQVALDFLGNLLEKQAARAPGAESVAGQKAG